MQPQMTFTDAIIEVVVQLAPTFVVACFVLMTFAWLRVLIDKMTGGM